MQLERVDAATVRPLRADVLRPGRPARELVFDGDEAPDTLHAAIVLDGRVQGVASAIRDPFPREPGPADWRIRGMATAPEMRGRGFGAALLACCEEHARRHDGARLWCNARVRARAFYERAGMRTHGGVFEIPPIGPHLLMSKRL